MLNNFCVFEALVFYDSGFRIPDSGFRIPDSGFRIPDSGFRLLGLPLGKGVIFLLTVLHASFFSKWRIRFQ